MLALAWANLMHNRLRTMLSVLAVGLGIALMLVSDGLASGSIAEVAERMQSVDAQLVVLPAQENVIFSGGAVFGELHERFLRKQADEKGPLALEVIPAFFGQVRMAGQQQRLFGVDPAQMELFLGSRRLVEGKVFDRARRLADRVAALRQELGRSNVTDVLTAAELDDGLEIVIDDRLQRVGNYKVGDEVRVMGRPFRIVGVVESGVAGRVFAPLQTMRQMLNAGEPWSSMFFLKLRADVDPVEAAEAFAKALGGDARVELKSEYHSLLRDSFAQVNLYMNVSSGLALVVCFLFILLTMYTLVIERTREIGILKSLGVTRAGLIGLSMFEALIISCAGVAIGCAFAFAAQYSMHAAMPLLTVALRPERLVLAVLVGVVGGLLSALYPGWRAARLEPAAALSYE